MLTRAGVTTVVEWGLAAERMPGETALGDQATVIALPRRALIGVVDGAGHGRDAEQAANIAVNVIEHFPERTVTELMALCHDALRSTRGVVMSLASIDAATSTMTWVGVGDVETIVTHELPGAGFKPVPMIPQAGILGYRLPKLQPRTVQLTPGVTAVFATDGVDIGFMHNLRPVGAPDRVAERILTAHGKGNDDALVLVARYTGSGA